MSEDTAFQSVGKLVINVFDAGVVFKLRDPASRRGLPDPGRAVLGGCRNQAADRAEGGRPHRRVVMKIGDRRIRVCSVLGEVAASGALERLRDFA